MKAGVGVQPHEKVSDKPGYGPCPDIGGLNNSQALCRKRGLETGLVPECR